ELFIDHRLLDGLLGLVLTACRYAIAGHPLLQLAHGNDFIIDHGCNTISKLPWRTLLRRPGFFCLLRLRCRRRRNKNSGNGESNGCSHETQFTHYSYLSNDVLAGTGVLTLSYPGTFCLNKSIGSFPTEPSPANSN